MDVFTPGTHAARSVEIDGGTHATEALTIVREEKWPIMRCVGESSGLK